MRSLAEQTGQRRTVVTGNVQLNGLGGGSSPMCGATIQGQVQLSASAGSYIFGKPAAGCAGNIVTGQMQVNSNPGTVQIFSNAISKQLQCSGNSAITGGANTAQAKQGQCSGF